MTPMTIDAPIAALAAVLRECPPDHRSRVDYASALIAAARVLLDRSATSVPPRVLSSLVTAQLDLRLAIGPEVAP